MTALQRFVFEHVFCGFLAGDPALMREIEAYDGDLGVEDGALVFTLPALFAFGCEAYARQTGGDPPTDRDHYLRFRKSLYASPTNLQVQRQGGHLELAAPNGKPDQRRYRLARRLSAAHDRPPEIVS